MPLNPLAPVTDYQSMLNRIFWFTTAAALAAIWILRISVPAVNALLGQIDFAVLPGSDGRTAPGGALVPALAFGVAARIFRLHARVSDWLGLRESFDLGVIVREFAGRLSIDLDAVEPRRLARQRHELMRRAFYAHVGGPQPAVDRQLIEQALEAWSWFWVGVEATIVFTLCGFGLIAAGAWTAGFETLGAALAFAAIGLPAIRSQCKRYAIAQVRAILADKQRAATVRRTMVELLATSANPATTSDIRRAA